MSNHCIKISLILCLFVWCVVCAGFGQQDKALANQKIEAAQLCLAGLTREFSWDLDKGAQKRSNGTYSHSNGNIHVFRSRLGSVMCKVERNRIIWANASGRWRDRSLDTYISYQIEGPKVIIHRRFSDGTVDQFSYQKSNLLYHLPVSKTCVPALK